MSKETKSTDSGIAQLNPQSSVLGTVCGWCHHRPAAVAWREMRLCSGCWIDLTVDEYLRAWSTDPAVARALTYKGIPLAATLEYDLLQELIAVFSKLLRPVPPPKEEATRG